VQRFSKIDSTPEQNIQEGEEIQPNTRGTLLVAEPARQNGHRAAPVPRRPRASSTEPARQNGHRAAPVPRRPGVISPLEVGKSAQQNGHRPPSVPRRPGVASSPQAAEQIQQNGHRSASFPKARLTPMARMPVTAVTDVPDTPAASMPVTPMPDVPVTPAATPATPAPAVPATPQPSIQPAIVDPHIRERVKYYARWLAKQASYDAQNDNSQEINSYFEEATKVVRVGDQEVAIFAPYRPKLSALQTFTTLQIVVFFAIGLLWIAGLLVFRLKMLTGVITAITVVYFFNLILNVSMALRTFRNSPEEHISDEIVHALKDADWPIYTILCPLYREARVVPQFAQAMQALDYPPDKLQILFLTESNDVETRDAIRALSLPPHFSILVVPDGKPRTKPRACNYGLMQAKGSYVVIYDAEDIPDPLQLKKAVLTFANHGTDVVCVQAKLNFYNIRQNLLTRWFTAEYSAWFDLILPGLQLANFSLPLGGTSNHFRTAALRALGGWDAYNVTEDCDLGLRLKRYRMNTVILDSTTLEEANSQLKNWLRQRSRWIKGYMQTYLVYMRHPLEYFHKGRLYDMFSFQVVIGSGTSVMFINPLMWVLLGLYIVLGPPVLNIYHQLFPGPTLYLGAFCLIFGNFFYIYIYLLACMKRKQYHLLPWTIFIPVYWLLMSIAALYALFELIVKPHYWQKTVHGLHLKGDQAAHQAPAKAAPGKAIEEPTIKVHAVSGKVSDVRSIPSVTSSLRAISTLILPAISKKQKQAQQVAKQSKVRDLWLVATVMIACILSIATTWYYFQQHEILLYQDSLSHMRISRGVFDSLTPGLAQLGSVWLPLPHILMWPFIWSDALWHSGLAGSFVSMPCYVIAATCLFLAARRLTQSSSASFIGTLIFILNPNVQYLQSIPLSETVCMATFALAAYFFLCWTQEGELRQLVIAAICTFLSTLARYDGWALFAGMFCCIALIGLMKRQRFLRIQANLVVFSFMGGLGIALWFLWNKLIFGDPLYFQKSLYSSQAQQSLQLLSGKLFSYHNLWQAIRFYTIDSGQTVGWVLLGLAAIGVIWFVLKCKFTPTTVAGLLFLIPFPFYILALYGGQAIIWLPGANPPGAQVYMYNVRYGAQMALPVALFVAVLIERLGHISPQRFFWLSRAMPLGIIVAQCLLISFQGVISLQDGQYSYACEPQRIIVQYLAEHYNGGRILQDVYASQFDASDAGIDFHNIIYEGSAPFWTQALLNPATSVEWVIVTPHVAIDPVAERANTDPSFLSQFELVAKQSNGILLYHHVGEPPLPSHPPLPVWNGPHPPCS
jgi:cellulose synthase/poly-beta-1,6-N-acetylglucosamine synthase-like glycosyltransferase